MSGVSKALTWAVEYRDRRGVRCLWRVVQARSQRAAWAKCETGIIRFARDPLAYRNLERLTEAPGALHQAHRRPCSNWTVRVVRG